MITKVTPPLSGTRKSVSEDKDDVRDVSTPVKESAELLRFKEAFNQGKVLANLLRVSQTTMMFTAEKVLYHPTTEHVGNPAFRFLIISNMIHLRNNFQINTYLCIFCTNCTNTNRKIELPRGTLIFTWLM